jgi:hypothetical protein
MSVRAGIKLDDQFFNSGHSLENPTTRSDFEQRLSRWVAANNPGAKADCSVKRGPTSATYVIVVGLENERVSQAWAVDGRTEIAFVVINGQPIASGYEEFIMKLAGADLSRLDDIVF